MDRPGPNVLTRLGRSWAVQVALLAVFGGWLWWTRATDLRLEYAAYGFSPMAYVHKTCHPERFARDFPSGVENVHKSAPMRLYVLAYRHLGVPPERLYPVFLAAEIVLMALAVAALVRTLRPEAAPFVATLVILMVWASEARNMNVASFAQPFLWAKYYNIADALRLLAIVAVLRGRPVLGGLALAGAMLSHPTMGLMGMVFVAATFAIAPRLLRQRRTLMGAAVFLVVAGIWIAAVVGSGQAVGEPFPKKLWVDLTRLNSGHWYPIDAGLLTFNHHAVFLPFLSFLILVGYALRRTVRERVIDQRAAAGMAAMLVLVVIGLLASVVPVSTTLIKLALHRSNDLVLTVGLVYAVAGLWREVEAGASWRRVVAVLLLVSPFVCAPGLPLALSLLLVLPLLLWPSQDEAGMPAGLLVIVPAAVAALALIAYAATGLLSRGTLAACTGLGGLTRLPVLIGAAVVILAMLAHRRLGRRAVVVAAAAGLLAAAVWYGQRTRLDPTGLRWCRSYLAAQRWAREHTRPDALFLVDPVIRHPGMGYGWRDCARRPCFGFLREWLYTGWCYASDHAVCAEGIERLRAFGPRIEDYVDRRPPQAAYRALASDLQRRYYRADDAWRRDLAQRYGIDYFVSKKLGTAAASRLPVAYENELFIIHAARPGSEPHVPAP